MSPVEYSFFLRAYLWVVEIRQTETVLYFGSEKDKNIKTREHKYDMAYTLKKALLKYNVHIIRFDQFSGVIVLTQLCN